MNLLHLAKIREYELERVLQELPPGGRVLEIGAGAGWQAKRLAERGFSVAAIDVAESNYAEEVVWRVEHYDGVHIPFPDESFDVVFSSNVLEHIPHVESFQDEIKRVLKPRALAVHLMPTGSWRVDEPCALLISHQTCRRSLRRTPRPSCVR